MNTVRIKGRDYLVPGIFSDLINEDSSFSIHSGKEFQNQGKIFKEIRSGKYIIPDQVERSSIEKIYRTLSERTDEFISFDQIQQVSKKSFSRKTKNGYDKIRNKILDRLLLFAENDKIISLTENPELRFAASFCGEDVYEDYGISFLLPYRFYKDLTRSLDEKVYINELQSEISAGMNVLLPRSQETTSLFAGAMDLLKIKSGLKIIDMGCGSGVLTILADKIFDSSDIYFSDILPEASASAIFNIEKNCGHNFIFDAGIFSCDSEKNRFICCRSGDLFEKIENKFDLIMFNPPWIDSEFRNRSERALNDKDQKLVERLLKQSKYMLNKEGKIVLAYSDNSGDKAVGRFNTFIDENGYNTEHELKDKIQSRQSGRKWMNIFVKILTLENGR
ncbi:MAG: class I SAM-dependent methyltransferase [Candidatus Delongbacteria bacterium]|nr:class I SAM-dependent methyltransferase [Candidatus Delongbacteria bacterium]